MYTGSGLYTLSDAARLIRAPSRSIDRWLFGYDYARGVDNDRRKFHSNPLWTPELPFEGILGKALGFRDLLELRVVREFVSHGIPLLVVRRCLETAKNLFGKDYPLSANRFATDGRTIFAQVISNGQEKELVDLRNKQIVFNSIIKPSLYAGIEYEHGSAKRWFPEGGRRRNVVIDPKIQFGKPITSHGCVPTEAIYGSFLAEGEDALAIDKVARIFELPEKEVRFAVRFEAGMRNAS